MRDFSATSHPAVKQKMPKKHRTDRRNPVWFYARENVNEATWYLTGCERELKMFLRSSPHHLTKIQGCSSRQSNRSQDIHNTSCWVFCNLTHSRTVWFNGQNPYFSNPAQHDPGQNCLVSQRLTKWPSKNIQNAWRLCPSLFLWEREWRESGFTWRFMQGSGWWTQLDFVGGFLVVASEEAVCSKIGSKGVPLDTRIVSLQNHKIKENQQKRLSSASFADQTSKFSWILLNVPSCTIRMRLVASAVWNKA